MVAIILAAGNGSRIADIYSCSSKCMLPFEGKPLLDKKLQLLSKCHGLNRLYIVVKAGEQDIQAYFGYDYNGIPIEYHIQDRNSPGIINAVYSVSHLKYMSHEEIIINLADEFYEELDYSSLITEHRSRKSSVTPVVIFSEDESRIMENYTVCFDENGLITEAIEKPSKVFNNYIGCGTIAVSGKLLYDFAQACKNKFDGKQLVDWIKYANDTNRSCYIYKAQTKYCNVNNKKNMKYLFSLSCKETTKSIGKTLNRVATFFPQRVAVRCDNSFVTYKELDEKSDAVACNVLQYRLSAEDYFTVKCNRTADDIISFLGILKAGLSYLPFDEKHLYEGAVQAANIAAKLPGDPERVLINSRLAANSATGIKAEVFDKLDKEHLEIGVTSMFSCYSSVQQIYSALLYGHTLNIIPLKAVFSPRSFVSWLNKVDVCDVTPHMIYYLIEYKRQNPHATMRAKHILTPSGGLDRKLIKEFFLMFETSSIHILHSFAGTTIPSAMFSLDKKTEEYLSHIPIGKPMRNTRIYILDSDRKIISAGKTGDIWLCGDAVSMVCYYNADEYNNMLCTDIIDSSCKMIKTGAKGYVDKNGYYCIADN
ncbi:MAG: AMP-binding protein [Clostridia bacterium]|nr:AMP-binding protein [Clostridia bacterium]